MKIHIALIGIRGSGKTTIGKILASEIEAEFIDIDKELMREADVENMINVIREKGKRWLAETENILLKKILSSNKKLVLGTGGRTFSHEFPEIKEKNIQIVRQFATTVLPLASKEEMWDRIVKDQYKQHAHLDTERLRENFINSLKFLDVYKKSADIIVKTDGKTPKEVAAEIKKLIEL